MIDERIYQIMNDELDEFLPHGWEKYIVYLEYEESSYTFSFHVKTKSGYVNGYDLPGVSDQEIDDAFKRIDEKVLNERKKETDSLWTNMTMIVMKTGDFHTDFDYTDLSEGAYQFRKDWKKKYLSD